MKAVINPLIRKSLLLLLLLNIFLGCNNKTKKNQHEIDDPMLKIANEYWSSGSDKEQKGDIYGAIADYTKAIQYGSKYSSFYERRASAKIDIKDYIGAVNDYTTAIRIENEKHEINFNAFHGRGVAKFFLKDYRGAIQDFNKVIRDDPENYWREQQMWLYYYRGLSKIGLNQKDSGCMDLSKSGELGLAKAYDAIKTYCQLN